ncbi:MAG: hypothetical protein EOM23_08765 [Candidatus Moranbacteria bacterium]|nr:hypothetical protein [Candidatus Moranbacteria bacterium]
MKNLALLVALLWVESAFAQKDIDVLFLKSGERIECTIQQISVDSLIISRFSGRQQVTNKYHHDEVAAYIVNNFYSTPAEDIIKATNRLYLGTSYMLVGGMVIGFAIHDDRRDLALIGTGIGLAGTLFIYAGLSKMNKAAKKMNKLQLQNDRIIYKL